MPIINSNTRADFINFISNAIPIKNAALIIIEEATTTFFVKYNDTANIM